MEDGNKKNVKSQNGLIIGIVICLVAVVTISLSLILLMGNNEKNEDKKEVSQSLYKINSNGIENFDLYFLQLENNKNMIYSPLSIKYALAMLKEATNGESKDQITNIIGDYNSKKYVNSKNMSFANALFVKESYKDKIKQEFTTNLMDKYGAEVIYDTFETPDKVNSWVKEKTLNLIDNILEESNSEQIFILLNALGIDMEWQNKFILNSNEGFTNYASYSHESFGWFGADSVVSGKFQDNEKDVAVMDVIASFNNYDIVKELGEENIRKTVGEEYRKYLKENYKNKTSAEIEKMVEEYLDNYIKDINSNYKREDKTTDFSFYVDDNVKVFAKDLKTYDGVTLQYVSLMPIKEDLSSYVKKMTAKDLNDTIGKLKDLKKENFKDGVVTKVFGKIPKFKFDYELDLVSDLKELGIKDIFDDKKADFSSMTSLDDVYINTALHKANIEFTQDGIKASAVTMMGGLGSAADFDYTYDVPTEEIDITFDKPYMFVIMDKNSKEVWFAGNVYNPLPWEKDPDYNNFDY